MVRAPSFKKRTHFAVFLLVAQATGGCASSSHDAGNPEDSNRTLAAAALAILAPKTEISFPPLPFKRKGRTIHRASPIAGYELIFADRSASDGGHAPPSGSCRITCIGGDCAIGPNSEEQLFLVQGKFVVSYSRMFGKSNRIIAFLASLKRSFEAPIIYLDCTLASHDSRGGTVEDLIAQLPPETQIDSVKNAGLTLTESLPNALPVYELATHKCHRRAGSPYPKAALFALTSKGVLSYDSTGHPLPYKIGCSNKGPLARCNKIADFLLSNGVTGCLF